MATPEQIAKIAALRGTGYQLEEISERVGLSTSSVSYQLSKMRKDAEVAVNEGDSDDIMDHMKKTLGTYLNRYVGIPSGTKYVVNREGVFLRLPGSGERLKVSNAEKLQKLYLSFREPGRVRLTDKGEVLAYWNPEDPEEDLDPDEDGAPDRALTNWCIIGTIDENLDGEMPFVDELPNDPAAYKPGDIWNGAVDGMRYSTDGGKHIFRSHPSGPRWVTKFKNSGLSRKIRSLFMELRDYMGGRLYITERGAVIANVNAENLELDFETVIEGMTVEQRQYLHGRIERTGLVPVFLGIHKGGIDLERSQSIHDRLTQGQWDALQNLFSLGGEEE
jgi:hypothetical protein